MAEGRFVSIMASGSCRYLMKSFQPANCENPITHIEIDNHFKRISPTFNPSDVLGLVVKNSLLLMANNHGILQVPPQTRNKAFSKGLLTTIIKHQFSNEFRVSSH